MEAAFAVFDTDSDGKARQCGDARARLGLCSSLGSVVFGATLLGWVFWYTGTRGTTPFWGVTKETTH